MANQLAPEVESWYLHLDKGQRFEVVAVDEENGLIELQHYDGDLEEVSMEEWAEMEIAPSEAPQNWNGAVDIGEIDDFGTEVTDTTREDWQESLGEFSEMAQRRLRKPAPPKRPHPSQRKQ